MSAAIKDAIRRQLRATINRDPAVATFTINAENHTMTGMLSGLRETARIQAAGSDAIGDEMLTVVADDVTVKPTIGTVLTIDGAAKRVKNQRYDAERVGLIFDLVNEASGDNSRQAMR